MFAELGKSLFGHKKTPPSTGQLEKYPFLSGFVVLVWYGVQTCIGEGLALHCWFYVTRRVEDVTVHHTGSDW